MPRALKDLLIACCLTLASVAAGVLLAERARSEPADARLHRPVAGQRFDGIRDQPSERGRAQIAHARLRSTGSQGLI